MVFILSEKILSRKKMRKNKQMGLTSPSRQPGQYLIPTAWELNNFFFQENYFSAYYNATRTCSFTIENDVFSTIWRKYNQGIKIT